MGDRPLRLHERQDGRQVPVAQVGEGHERQHRPPVGVDTVAQDARHFLVAVAADAGGGVRGDVGDVECANGQVELHAPRQGNLLAGLHRGMLAGVAVAVGAVGRTEHQVSPTLDHGGIAAGGDGRIGRGECPVLAGGGGCHEQQ